MPLTIGSRLGPYEILAPHGAGGMGEVYRARDARLQRDVALKVLPGAFAQDAERVARFEREAKLLASLNHPYIGALYGLEESEGQRVLVLELVEGVSLAERLKRGRMPLDEALPIASQIASALDAAHESGVVHRDLKPGNVMLRNDGTVKVLDFGLAKGGANDGTARDPNLSASPTMTYAATHAGVILGTAAYMSPEQARGRTVDRRSDIWSFGCVLYELLTARQAFAGETVSDTLAAILKSEPDWSALPQNTPRRVRELLARCLRKDPATRLRDAGDARIAIEEVIASPNEAPESVAAPASGGSRGAMLALGAITLLALAFAAWTAMHGAKRETHAPARVTLDTPSGVTLTGAFDATALSPDGTALVFVAQDSLGTASIFVRDLATIGVRRIEGTENAVGVFWSPDSKRLGVFCDGKLKLFARDGSASRVLCDAPDPRGASWGSRGTIVFAPNATGNLLSVDVESGATAVAVAIDSVKGETSARFPTFMPDGKHFLFVCYPRDNGRYPVFFAELGALKRTVVFTAESAPFWGGDDRLLTTLQDRFVAIPIDPSTGKPRGRNADLGEAPLVAGHDACYAGTASAEGKLCYIGGSLANTAAVWLDRSGKRLGTVPLPTGRWESVALTADGKQLAVSKRLSPSETKIWVVDPNTGDGGPVVTSSTRPTLLWSPDGRMLAYQNEVKGNASVFVRDMTNGESHKLVPNTRTFENLWGWSPDSKQVYYCEPNTHTGWDVFSASADGSGKPQALAASNANENGGVLSPDGKWFLYTSDESGRFEIYVRSYPDGSERKQLRALGVAANAVSYSVSWSPDGREIMVLSTDVIVYPVELTPTLQIGPPRLLFTPPASTVYLANSADQQRLLATLPLAATELTKLTMVTDWWSLLDGSSRGSH